MSQPQVTFEIKAQIRKRGVVLSEFDSEQSARTWIEQARAIELWVKDGEKWVKRDDV